MELREMVRQSIEAMLIMDQYGRPALDASGGFGGGDERVFLVSAVRAKLGDAVTDRLAWEIADFVPLALARGVLTEMGVNLHDHYVRIDGEGRLRTYRRLEDEPVFREAAAQVMDVAAVSSESLLKLSMYSAEFRTVNQALFAGSRSKDLVAAPPVLNGPEELCDPLEAAPVFEEPPWWMDSWKTAGLAGALKRPWWKFW